MNLIENRLVHQKHISNCFGKGVDFAKRVLVVKKVLHLLRRLRSDQLAKQKAPTIPDKADGMESWIVLIYGHFCPYLVQGFPISSHSNFQYKGSHYIYSKPGCEYYRPESYLVIAAKYPTKSYPIMQDELHQLQEAEGKQHAGRKEAEKAETSKNVSVSKIVTLKDLSPLLICLAV